MSTTDDARSFILYRDRYIGKKTWLPLQEHIKSLVETPNPDRKYSFSEYKHAVQECDNWVYHVRSGGGYPDYSTYVVELDKEGGDDNIVYDPYWMVHGNFRAEISHASDWISKSGAEDERRYYLILCVRENGRLLHSDTRFVGIGDTESNALNMALSKFKKWIR